MSEVDNREWYQIGYEAAKQELKREPLSYEKIVDIIQYNMLNGLHDLARAIEKAHGIGVDDE